MKTYQFFRTLKLVCRLFDQIKIAFNVFDVQWVLIFMERKLPLPLLHIFGKGMSLVAQDNNWNFREWMENIQ